MLITSYQHLTKKRQKDEELMFDDVDERRKRRRKTKTKTKDENEDERRKRRSKKNRRKLKNVFKTNVLGSEVARYVVRRQLTSYLIPNTASGPDRSDQGKLLAQWNHHKIPEISICRRRRFLDSTD